MKKSTKILITVAAIAAVVGVGAVSYAAWSGGDTTSQEIDGTTGAVRTIGDITVTPSEATGATITALNALYPIDYNGDGVTYWEFALSTDITGGGTPDYKLAGKFSSAVSAKLYWSATQPTAATGAVAANELTTTAKALTGLTDDTVYVYMVATGTDAMSASIELTFSAQ